MCLHVVDSYVLKPIPVVPVFKDLIVTSMGRAPGSNKRQLGFFTPFRYARIVFGDGYFKCKQPYNATREFSNGDTISGGYIHSYAKVVVANQKDQTTRITKLTERNTYTRANFHFRGLALDVVATGYYKDYVSHMLYLPQFDLRNYTKEEIVWLKKTFGASFNTHSADILKQIRSA
jgi:hypothetical protein